MSDLANAARLRQASPQLPASWYCDPRVFDAERRVLFAARAGLRRPRADGARTGRLSRARRARQRAGAGAQRARRRAAVQRLPAPAGDHARRARATRRTSSARSIAGPTTSRASSSAHRILPRSLASISGVHAADALERAAVRRPARRRGATSPGLTTTQLDFSGYVFDRVEMHECNYNWKTFIEVYLEDYHVEPFHPGLGQFVTCDDLDGSSPTGRRCSPSA